MSLTFKADLLPLRHRDTLSESLNAKVRYPTVDDVQSPYPMVAFTQLSLLSNRKWLVACVSRELLVGMDKGFRARGYCRVWSRLGLP